MYHTERLPTWLFQARLEEYPEFEYLRNILFQYMCGRQPLILVKVLSAIVKFTPEQVTFGFQI